MAWPSSGASQRGVRQRRALGDGELQLDEVEPGDELGDRVLDLQPGVHLEEPEAAVRLEQELDRAGTDVADGLAAAIAASAIRRRSSSSTAGEGDSSMIFWCRRWIEHSRSWSETTSPWASASTWISTWRPRST